MSLLAFLKRSGSLVCDFGRDVHLLDHVLEEMGKLLRADVAAAARTVDQAGEGVPALRVVRSVRFLEHRLNVVKQALRDQRFMQTSVQLSVFMIVNGPNVTSLATSSALGEVRPACKASRSIARPTGRSRPASASGSPRLIVSTGSPTVKLGTIEKIDANPDLRYASTPVAKSRSISAIIASSIMTTS